MRRLCFADLTRNQLRFSFNRLESSVSAYRRSLFNYSFQQQGFLPQCSSGVGHQTRDPVHVNSHRFATVNIQRGPINSQSMLEKTSAWAESATRVGHMTPHLVALGRKLLEDWNAVKKTSSIDRDYATALTRICHTFLLGGESTSSTEVLELLHRTLHAWSNSNVLDEFDYVPVTEAGHLFQSFVNTSRDRKDGALFPGDKAFSMLFVLLAKYPKHEETLEFAKEFYNLRLRNGRTPPDTVFFISFLHTIAMCSSHFYDVDYLYRLVNAVIRTMPHKPDAKCYSSVLFVISNSSYPHNCERASKVISHMMEIGIANTITCNQCLELLAKHGHADVAEGLVENMLQCVSKGNLEVRPNSMTFYHLVKAQHKRKGGISSPRSGTQVHLDKLLRMFSSCQADSTVQLFTAVMLALANDKNQGPSVEHMLKTLESRYQESGLVQEQPSLHSYMAAIQAWGNSDDQDAPVRAEAIFRRLQDFHRLDGRKETAPNAHLYTALIHTWAQSNQRDAPEHALAILREMQMRDSYDEITVPPTTATFNAVMNAFAKQGRTDEALDLFYEMVHSKDEPGFPPPDDVSLSILLLGYGKSKIPFAGKQAAELISEIEEGALIQCGLSIKSKHYARVILALGRSQAQDAVEDADRYFWGLVQKLAKESLPCTIDTRICNSILQVWAESKEPVAPRRAENILQWMEQQVRSGNRDIAIDVDSFNHLMKVWMKSKRGKAHEKVKALFRKLQSSSFCPTIESVNHLMASIAYSRDPNRASVCFSMLKGLIANNQAGEKQQQGYIRPNRQSFVHVINACRNPNAEAEEECRRILRFVVDQVHEIPDVQPLPRWMIELMDRTCAELQMNDVIVLENRTPGVFR